MKYIIVLVICCTVLFACISGDKAVKPDLLAANLDSIVKPGEDFFQYANGGWIKRTPIPESESGWGIGNMVEEEIYSRKKKINEDASTAKNTPGTITQKIGDFWHTAMDSIAIEKKGPEPIIPFLDQITAIKNATDLFTVGASLKIRGVDCFFSDYVSQDDKNSEMMAYKFDQGGLGMPNRDYYFNTDERTVKVRTAYKVYLLKVCAQISKDVATAQKNADAVFALETRLAKASRKLQDLRDPYKNYNKMSWAQLSAIAPAINWINFAKSTGVTNTDSVIIGQPEFYSALSNEIKSTPIDVWKNYLSFHVMASYARYLNNSNYINAFEYEKSMTGASSPRPRWKRVLDAEEGAMGEALGQLFAKEYFNETAKKRYTDMVEAIRDAFKERIAKLPWMSDSTKQKAYSKLAKISKKVGYPDKWKDFSALKIDTVSFAANMIEASIWWHNYNINKLGKPVDRTEWGMTPQTYNAYYNPSNNEIVLPAGIFAVPGYKDEELDDALVYGYAAASTIGHEITHGFDDQGRQYDEAGNLKNWWTANDEKEFTKRAQSIIQQFNEFIPVDTLHINGNATQGENIADLGGMLLG
ncbi:MAG: M13 family metallopeptidase, partial [Ferruginibacter sp.]